MFAAVRPVALGRTARAAVVTTRAPPRHLSFLSPRQVLRYSGQSWVATAVTLAALTLFVRPDWLNQAADEAAHVTTSLTWTQDALDKRAWAYRILAKVPRNATLPVDPNAAAATNANLDAKGAHFKLHAFGKDLVDTDLGDIDALLARMRTTLAAAANDLVPTSVRTSLTDAWAAIRPAVDSSKPVTDVRSATAGDSSDSQNRLPFARPDMGTRAFAWLIDSACVGLLASPFWRGPIYGGVVTLVWLGKDFIFPLVPGLRASPGYHLLGLEKVHVATANQARANARAPDAAQAFAHELPGMLGHNTLRFLTWCNSIGSVSGVASLVWVAYALTNGLEATMVAWDKLAGVQIVHRDDLVEFEQTGKIPVRAARSGTASWVLDVDDAKDNNKHFQGSLVHADTGKVVDWKFEVVPGGGAGEGSAPAKLVVIKRISVEGKVQSTQTSQLELPRWITVNGPAKE